MKNPREDRTDLMAGLTATGLTARVEDSNVSKVAIVEVDRSTIAKRRAVTVVGDRIDANWPTIVEGRDLI